MQRAKNQAHKKPRTKRASEDGKQWAQGRVRRNKTGEYEGTDPRRGKEKKKEKKNKRLDTYIQKVVLTAPAATAVRACPAKPGSNKPLGPEPGDYIVWRDLRASGRKWKSKKKIKLAALLKSNVGLQAPEFYLKGWKNPVIVGGKLGVLLPPLVDFGALPALDREKCDQASECNDKKNVGVERKWCI